jgi:hypothetical protein
MNGRRESCWLRWLGLLVCTGLLLLTSGAAAESVRVLLLAPAQAELTARIRGQTRDLGIAIEQAEPEAALTAAAATEAGRAQGADLVVWAESSGANGLTLHILELETGQLRSRAVSTPANETLASSTTAEMGGLVVRSELSALLAERQARHEAAAQRASAPDASQRSAAPPSTTPAPEVQPPPSVPPRPFPPSGPWLLAFGYRPDRPLKSAWAHGFALTARRDLAGFALGLSASASLPVPLARADSRISLSRVQLRLEGLKQWSVSERTRLALGLAANLSFNRRSTERAGADREATAASTSVSGSFGLFAEAQWLFVPGVGGFVAGGADAVPWRTKFVLDDGDQETRLATLSWLDPWVMVGLFTRFGR